MAKLSGRAVCYLSIGLGAVSVTACIALAVTLATRPDPWGPRHKAENFRADCLAIEPSPWAGRGPIYKAQDFFSDPKVAGLAEAAREGDCRRIDALIAAGVGVNARGKEGLTPLIYSISGGNTAGFQRLLERGADPNQQTDDGDSAIATAAQRSGPEFLKIVLAHGGNPNLRSRPKPRPVNSKEAPHVNYKATPIYNAMESRNPENARILVKAGADLNARNAMGWTPLMAAATMRSYDVMLVLLEAGADFRATEENGYPVSKFMEFHNLDPKSPFVAARRKCMEFMEKHGVDFEKEKVRNAEIARQIEGRLDRDGKGDKSN